MTKKIKLKKPGFYNCNYPEGSVIEVDDAYAAYALGMGDAEAAKEDEKITDAIPYAMKPRVSGAEEALTILANSVAQQSRPAPAPVSAPSVAKP